MSADLLDSLDIFVPEDISEWVQICLLVWIGIFVPEDIISEGVLDMLASLKIFLCG